MAGFTIKVSDNSFSTIAEMKAAVNRGLEAAGLHLEGEAKEELNRPMPHKTPPYERPYIDTGTLRNDIKSAVHDSTVYTGTNVPYAVYIHNGTSKIEPNRFLADAYEHNIDQIKEFLENALKG